MDPGYADHGGMGVDHVRTADEAIGEEMKIPEPLQAILFLFGLGVAVILVYFSGSAIQSYLTINRLQHCTQLYPDSASREWSVCVRGY